MDATQNPVNEIEEIQDEIDIAFKNFKQFDIVSGSSDHWYFYSTTLIDRKQKTIAKIQQEWKDLEQNLPASIYVRAFNERIDLLRAALIGCGGTPYNNGVFFIDIQFPCNYPSDPPKLYFHCHGLRLNPKLSCSGKVSLTEKWVTDSSSILGVLVKIQELVLNEKPYFKHGYESKGVSFKDFEKSLEYNKQVMMLSFKVMLNTIQNPPRNFEDFVFGHFRKNSHKILMDCKGYLDGDENMDGGIFMELMNVFQKNGSYCRHFLGYTKELKERKLKPGKKMMNFDQGTSFFNKIGFRS